MSTSSQPQDYSITLTDPISTSDVITITGSSSGITYTTDTITLPTYSYSGGSTYTVSSGLTTAQIGALSGTTISSITLDDLKISMPVEWVDCFPEFARIEKMCQEYPGLKIAFEKFKTTYYLVKDDYDTPKDQRVKP